MITSFSRMKTGASLSAVFSNVQLMNISRQQLVSSILYIYGLSETLASLTSFEIFISVHRTYRLNPGLSGFSFAALYIKLY